MTQEDQTPWPIWSGRIAELTVALLCLSARSAEAYTDPGSGALLWQMGLAAVFGALFYVRRAVSWMRTRFISRGPDEPQA